MHKTRWLHTVLVAVLVLSPLLFVLAWPPAGLALRLRSGQAQERSDSIDVILIVDNSGSMASNDPQRIRVSAAKLFVDLSQDGDRIGLVNLGDDTRIVKKLTTIMPWLDHTRYGRRELKDALQSSSEPKGATPMGTALRHAYNMLDETAPGRRQFVVMLTDGKPEGESPEILNNVLADFRKKRFWTIFPIALGDAPDMNFLNTAMANPTGGRAFKAQTPVDLIRVYTEIFAMMRYNRYVDWVTVQPNVLNPLMTIDPEQKVQNLAFVIPRPKKDDPFVDVIVSPNDVNIVDPAVSGHIYHADDPRYEVFVMESDHVLLDGAWQARFGSDHPVELAMLVHSAYGIQLSSPPAQEAWNELSKRYAPVGKRFYVQLGARDSSVGLGAVTDLRALWGELTPLLSPVVQMESPAWDSMTLRDDGLGQDEQRDDGLYTGRYQKIEAPGQYYLRIQIPSQKDDAVRLVKHRLIEARNLPFIIVRIPESQARPPNTSLLTKVVIRQPEGEIQINNVDIVMFVKSPDGKTTALTPQMGDDGEYAATFAPSVPGPHDVVAVANFRVMQPEGEIAYNDLDLQTYEAVFPSRGLTIAASRTDLGTMDQFRNTTLVVEVTSDSSQTEQLEVKLEGLPGGTVSPASLDVPPGATTSFELIVGSTEVSDPGSGSFTLNFSTPDEDLSLNNTTLSYDYRISYGLSVRAENTELGEVDMRTDVKATLFVQSNAPTEQTLQVAVVAPAGAEVWPTSITAPPREETPFTFSVSLPETAPEEGSFQLALTSMDDAVEVTGGEVTFTYQLITFRTRDVCIPIIVVALLLLAGFVVWRKSKKPKDRRRRR